MWFTQKYSCIYTLEWYNFKRKTKGIKLGNGIWNNYAGTIKNNNLLNLILKEQKAESGQSLFNLKLGYGINLACVQVIELDLKDFKFTVEEIKPEGEKTITQKAEEFWSVKFPPATRGVESPIR